MKPMPTKTNQRTVANVPLPHLAAAERDAIRVDVEEAISELLHALRIAPDHNTRDTARRVAKMYVDEVCRGRFHPPPAITSFPNVAHLDELITVGPISVRSLCSHHFAPIIGHAYIGVLPGESVIGLSKYTRIVDHVMARPQIQEEATVQVADAIEAVSKPRGVAVMVRANHLCMTWRGVRDHGSLMTTSVMRGLMAQKSDLKAEFLTFVDGAAHG